MKNSSMSIRLIAVLGLGFGMIASLGCGEKPQSETVAGAADEEQHEAHPAHPSEGPHNGGLVELGNEEYHIEIVHNEETGSVTAYVLDSMATKMVPITAAEITVNVSHDGAAEQFLLAASPQEGDPEGKSSRFVSSGAELGEDLDKEDVKASLVVTIADKQYRGTIAHAHEHDDEHEEHGDHDEHAGHAGHDKDGEDEDHEEEGEHEEEDHDEGGEDEDGEDEDAGQE